MFFSLRQRTVDIYREEVRRYTECMYMAVYSNFVHACCIMAGDENWSLSPVMESELRGLREYVKVNDVTILFFPPSKVIFCEKTTLANL